MALQEDRRYGVLVGVREAGDYEGLAEDMIPWVLKKKAWGVRQGVPVSWAQALGGSANGGSGCLWAYMILGEDGTFELADFNSGVNTQRKKCRTNLSNCTVQLHFSR